MAWDNLREIHECVRLIKSIDGHASKFLNYWNKLKLRFMQPGFVADFTVKIQPPAIELHGYMNKIDELRLLLARSVQCGKLENLVQIVHGLFLDMRINKADRKAQIALVRASGSTADPIDMHRLQDGVGPYVDYLNLIAPASRESAQRMTSVAQMLIPA